MHFYVVTVAYKDEYKIPIIDKEMNYWNSDDRFEGCMPSRIENVGNFVENVLTHGILVIIIRRKVWFPHFSFIKLFRPFNTCINAHYTEILKKNSYPRSWVEGCKGTNNFEHGQWTWTVFVRLALSLYKPLVNDSIRIWWTQRRIN